MTTMRPISRQKWHCLIISVSCFLSTVLSLDSINMDLEILSRIDVSDLGQPDLNLYNGKYNLTIDGDNSSGDSDSSSSCRYTLRIDLNIKDSLEKDVPGEPNFTSECAPTNATGVSPYVYETTGFDHVSVNWIPCGTKPLGYQKPRYDLNFYTVLPQYRTFMTCDVFKTPEVCQYNQNNPQGRSQFTLPRLVNDPNFLANMPIHFQPDLEFPEAFQYEGLMNFDKDNIPVTPDDWKLPTFLMSTYDAAVVSWRAMIPHSFIYKKETATSSQSQFYVFQTMIGLPSEWNMSFDLSTGILSVRLHGASINHVCGADFDKVKNELEYDIVFEEPDNSKKPELIYNK